MKSGALCAKARVFGDLALGNDIAKDVSQLSGPQ
jgi:hypothetical protein